MQVRYITIAHTPAGAIYIAETPIQHHRTRRDAQRASRCAVLQERLGAALAGVGFFLMLGGAGAADLAAAPLGDCFAWSLGGFAALALGLYMAHAFYGQEAAAQWKKKKGT